MKTLGFFRTQLLALICAIIFFAGGVNAMAQRETHSGIANSLCHDSLKNELLSSFHIDHLKGAVRVIWSSAKPGSIDRFEIQRSDNNNEFRTVGILFPEQEKNDFVFFDKTQELKNNKWYQYRIKLVNDSKNELYSCIQKIKW